MISIGAIIGGPEASFFSQTLNKFMQHCEKQEPTPSNASVNIVYHLPGSMMKPEHIGIRTAKFSKVRSMLMIQVAVEEEFISSRDASEVFEYIVETADESIALAKSKFDNSGIPYNIDIDRDYLNKWNQ